MVIDTGTCAAAGSLEKSRTTVGSGSANGTSTVPVVDSPFRTESGLIESAPMVPAAIADAGTRERAPASTHIRSPRPRAAHPRDVVLPCLRAAERYIPPRPVVVGARTTDAPPARRSRPDVRRCYDPWVVRRPGRESAWGVP